MCIRDRVITPRVHPAQGVVEAPAEPRQGDVVAEQRAGQSRASTPPSRTAPEARVVLEVDVVVPVEEGPRHRWQEADQGQEEHQCGEPMGSRSGGRHHCHKSPTTNAPGPSGKGPQAIGMIDSAGPAAYNLSLIHISEPTRLL